MKTAEPTINGVTLKDITRMMHNIEKLIGWYNRTYNFGMLDMPEKEQKEHTDLISRWDFLKSKRDELLIAKSQNHENQGNI